MAEPIVSRLTLDISGALCSHTPLYFAAVPAARSAMTPAAASRLLYISSWKLNSETAREEPRLRNLLGHISIYDKTRTFSYAVPDSSDEALESKTSPYLAYQVPSFKAFQAAIQDQLATMAKVATTSTLLHVHGDEIEDDSDDSDYDSYDGDEWTDEDTSAESDESFTDNESTEGQWSECTSPTAAFCDDEEEDSDLWAIRPLATTTRQKSLEVR